ncbi:uncharacterized protein LOC125501418 [Athalia rosae]|uniref:uncharacterized protein LOC125501418 n=1 Tax=Athalia rosae TaxID=37344 RepID=UPI002033261A|nr:uncharacterized protein LOC125501418 [Athalia rosae]XP_048513166.1 uncharacterized protein LOC125501418 [Athalia rosae]
MPNIKFTSEQRKEMVRQYYGGMSYRQIARHFGAAPGSVTGIIQRFNQTGDINPTMKGMTQPKRHLSEDIKLAVCLKAQEDSQKPLSQIAEELNISKSSVSKIMKQAKNKTPRVKEPLPGQLQPMDHKKRLTFCNAMLDRIKVDRNLIHRICFTGECKLIMNRQYIEVLTENNPEPQCKCQLNFWLGVLDDRLIGPIFYDNDLDDNHYLQLLKTQIVPALRAIERNGPAIWYQQDTRLALSTVPVRHYLDKEFPDRWMGKYGPIKWPMRSPDLSPLDYALWPNLKNMLHDGKQFADASALQLRVEEIFRGMDSQCLRNITSTFPDHLYDCRASRGRLLEFE